MLLGELLRRLMRVWRSEQRREHPLQPADEHIGLAAALGQLLDLRVFGGDLSAQEIDLALKASDIARVGVACRGLS